jgi:SAM-dependent methyltransferase
MNTSTLSLTNALTYYTLRTIGQTSDSIRLGFQRGFDSGEMMDRVYANRPSGRYGFGWLADVIYLNQIGCRGLRGRKALLKSTLRGVIRKQQRAGLQPLIVDIASGPANYLVETLANERGARAIARDLDKSGLRRGKELARAYGVTNIRYDHANAFGEASLGRIQPRPTIMVASGFYEILFDDDLIRRSMAIVRRTLAPGGTFIFTTQVNHPQLELIRALPNRDGDSWVMKNRSVAAVEAWVKEAGFGQVTTALEPNRVFSVSVAR